MRGGACSRVIRRHQARPTTGGLLQGQAGREGPAPQLAAALPTSLVGAQTACWVVTEREVSVGLPPWQAVVATEKLHSPAEAATRILPAVAPLAVDPIEDVRSHALAALDRFVAVRSALVLQERHACLQRRTWNALSAFAACIASGTVVPLLRASTQPRVSNKTSLPPGCPTGLS